MPISKKQLIHYSLYFLAALLVALALLWYFQQQGFIKVFPTSQEREIKKVLEIDESDFTPANGLSPEVFQERIQLLYKLRQDVLADPENAQPWFVFGNAKEFLNDHEGAIAAWKKTLEFQPQNFVAAANIATNYQYFLRDFEQAEFYYYEALSGSKAYTPAYQGLADLYQYSMPERKELFEPLLQDAAVNDPKNAIPYYVSLVEFFAEEGDLTKAREYLQSVEEQKPDSAAQLRENYPEL